MTAQLIQLRYQAIQNTHPTVIGINASGAIDADGNIVEVDESLVQPEIQRLQALEPARIAGEKRRIAYAAEADPLFFKAQRGEATLAEWQAKVAEIKARYPKE